MNSASRRSSAEANFFIVPENLRIANTRQHESHEHNFVL